MGQTLTLELSDEAYNAIRRQAEATGISPAQVAATSLEQQFGGPNGSPTGNVLRTEDEKRAARERFAKHFGAVNLGYPTGADNESIDADLAREYADRHEDS
jgi:hypothetical protein